MIELLIFLLVTGAVVAWWQLMQGRQKARKVADLTEFHHLEQAKTRTIHPGELWFRVCHQWRHSQAW
jgi:hypothetical protein